MLALKILAVVCSFYAATALRCYSCDNCSDHQPAQEKECSPQDDMCSIITDNGAVKKGCESASGNGLCLKTNLENLGNVFNNLSNIDINKVDFNNIDLNRLQGDALGKLNTKALDLSKINMQGVNVMQIIQGIDTDTIDMSKVLQGNYQGIDISKLNLQGVDLNKLLRDVDKSKLFEGVDLNTLDPQILQILADASKRSHRSATSPDIKCCKDKDLCNGEDDIKQVTSTPTPDTTHSSGVTTSTPSTTNKAAHVILDTMAMLMVAVLLKLSY